jgi:hypothetical protein
MPNEITITGNGSLYDTAVNGGTITGNVTLHDSASTYYEVFCKTAPEFACSEK